MTSRARGLTGTDHNSIRMLEIPDRRAFTQKFRVRDYREVGVGVLLPHDALNFVAGPDRNRGFGDDHREFRKRPRNLAGGRIDVRQISMPITAA
jgi:hypothetical protein